MTSARRCCGASSEKIPGESTQTKAFTVLYLCFKIIIIIIKICISIDTFPLFGLFQFLFLTFQKRSMRYKKFPLMFWQYWHVKGSGRGSCRNQWLRLSRHEGKPASALLKTAWSSKVKLPTCFSLTAKTQTAEYAAHKKGNTKVGLFSSYIFSWLLLYCKILTFIEKYIFHFYTLNSSKYISIYLLFYLLNLLLFKLLIVKVLHF